MFKAPVTWQSSHRRQSFHSNADCDIAEDPFRISFQSVCRQNIRSFCSIRTNSNTAISLNKTEQSAFDDFWSLSLVWSSVDARATCSEFALASPHTFRFILQFSRCLLFLILSLAHTHTLAFAFLHTRKEIKTSISSFFSSTPSLPCTFLFMCVFSFTPPGLWMSFSSALQTINN